MLKLNFGVVYHIINSRSYIIFSLNQKTCLDLSIDFVIYQLFN